MKKEKARSGNPPETALRSAHRVRVSSRRGKTEKSRAVGGEEVQGRFPNRREDARDPRADSETGAPVHAARSGSGSPLRIPPLLLEGDDPAASGGAGAGRKYVLGQDSPAHVGTEEGELPESYGRQRLLLMARDPHWLYVHWDLTREQHRRYNALASHHHLVVRVHLDTIAGQPLTEVKVHPESRHWFIQVERANANYVAALGYYRPDGQWATIATSAAVATPPDTVCKDKGARFETIPAEAPARVEQLPPTGSISSSGYALIQGELFSEASGASGRPGAVDPWVLGPGPYTGWTIEQERALAEMIGLSATAAGISSGPGGEGESVSSPFGGGEARRKGFWFNLTPELVLYGATEPDASVTIGGEPIELRADGTFSCRFALPDGSFELKVAAVSAENEVRRVELRFSRSREYREE